MPFSISLCNRIGQCAITSLLYEVAATPKPGLVDRFNNGAHKDMDFFSFMASTGALSSYFTKCALTAAQHQGSPKELFNELRSVGMEAETAMFEATGGVNTHKGLIFSLGVISAAAARCMAENGGKPLEADLVCGNVSLMTRDLCLNELNQMDKNDVLTHGEKLYRSYGLKGVRGEAESGFETVRVYSLPVYTELKSTKAHTPNDILVQTLLHLIAVNEDTNIVARHDLKTLDYAKKYASYVLEMGGILSPHGKLLVLEMDRDFISRNISPGGSADLLAVTVMLDLLSHDLFYSTTPIG